MLLSRAPHYEFSRIESLVSYPHRLDSLQRNLSTWYLYASHCLSILISLPLSTILLLLCLGHRVQWPPQRENLEYLAELVISGSGFQAENNGSWTTCQACLSNSSSCPVSNVQPCLCSAKFCPLRFPLGFHLPLPSHLQFKSKGLVTPFCPRGLRELNEVGLNVHLSRSNDIVINLPWAKQVFHREVFGEFVQHVSIIFAWSHPSSDQNTIQQASKTFADYIYACQLPPQCRIGFRCQMDLQVPSSNHQIKSNKIWNKWNPIKFQWLEIYVHICVHKRIWS